MAEKYDGFVFSFRQEVNEEYAEKKGWDKPFFDFYNCETCGSSLTEQTILKNDGECPSCEDIVTNPNEYMGFTVIRNKKGICRKNMGKDVLYNCDKCNSTIAEESILKGRHKCSRDITDKLD